MNAGPLLHTVTLLVAASAFVLALRDAGERPPAALAATTDAGLADEVHRLRQQVDALLARPAPAAASPGDVPQRTAVADADLLRRIEHLEQLGQRRGGQAADGGTAVAAGLDDSAASLDRLEQMLERVRERQRERERSQQTQRAVESAAVSTDPTKPEADRLMALRFLRGAGRDARSGAVAQAAIALVQTSQDAATRADVWRQMSGAKDPVLIPHLIRSLQTDAGENVREEAAETLADYLDDPTARAALQAAAQDASERVRRQVARSLGGSR